MGGSDWDCVIGYRFFPLSVRKKVGKYIQMHKYFCYDLLEMLETESTSFSSRCFQSSLQHIQT